MNTYGKEWIIEEMIPEPKVDGRTYMMNRLLSLCFPEVDWSHFRFCSPNSPFQEVVGDLEQKIEFTYQKFFVLDTQEEMLDKIWEEIEEVREVLKDIEQLPEDSKFTNIQYNVFSEIADVFCALSTYLWTQHRRYHGLEEREEPIKEVETMFATVHALIQSLKDIVETTVRYRNKGVMRSEKSICRRIVEGIVRKTDEFVEAIEIYDKYQKTSIDILEGISDPAIYKDVSMFEFFTPQEFLQKKKYKKIIKTIRTFQHAKNYERKE